MAPAGGKEGIGCKVVGIFGIMGGIEKESRYDATADKVLVGLHEVWKAD